MHIIPINQRPHELIPAIHGSHASRRWRLRDELRHRAVRRLSDGERSVAHWRVYDVASWDYYAALGGGFGEEVEGLGEGHVVLAFGF